MLLYGLLAGGSSIWWLLVLTLFLFLLVAIARSADQENFKLCSFFFIITLTALHLFGLVDIVNLAFLHWEVLLFAGVVYIALGFPWVYHYEWSRFLSEEYQKREDYLAALLPEKAAVHPYRQEPIRARDHKGKIIGWMLWWPAMLLYTIIIRWILQIADQIVKFWQAVYKRFVHLFQAKSDQMFARLLKVSNRTSEIP